MNNVILTINRFKKKFSFSSGITYQIFFIKKLSFLIEAQVPLFQALTILGEQSSNRKNKKIIENISGDIANGQSLALSLSKNTGFLGDFAIYIIQIGERSGMLAENLEYLSKELEKRSTLKKKIFGAFIYPLVVCIATLGITLFLILYLFPKIVPVFQSLHTQLPLSTRILMVVSRTVHVYWLYGIITTIFALAACTFLIRSIPRIQFLFHTVLISIPIFGSILKSYFLTQITRTAGLLLESGLPVSEVIPIISGLTSNLVYKAQMRIIAESIMRGSTVSQGMMTNKRLFPEMTIQVISIGEKSGNLATSFLYMSDYFEQEVDNFTKNLSTIIEPLLMVCMGLVVGFIAISIITPIYGITQNLHP